MSSQQRRRAGTVAVVGSLNIDWIARVPQLPRPGETIAARDLRKAFGGKGANQAIAAARQRARVDLIGCVGDDPDGRAYRHYLRKQGVRATAVTMVRNELTGAALIGVDDRAENLIMVAPGANGRLSAAGVRRQRRIIEAAHVLLLQCETPRPSVIEAIRLANTRRVRVVLNPSPWPEDFPWGELLIDCLVVNAGEASRLLAVSPEQLERATRRVSRRLREWSITSLVITRGAQPTLCLANDELHRVPCLPVQPVDTVGAGDAFAGALAAAWAEGETLTAAVARGNCAGALATLQPGAQPAIPTRQATLRALARWRRLASES